MSLAGLMPELVADIEAALVQLGRGDLADQVRVAPLVAISSDPFAATIDLHMREPDPARMPGEIFSLQDEIGVSLEMGEGGLARLEVAGYEDILARFSRLEARRALFRGESFRAVEMYAFDVARLQAFFEANPGYFETTSGAPPAAGQAHEAFHAKPPEGWPYTRKWMLLVVDDAGEILAVADILADLFAAGVWHVGLFATAASLHGSGRAHAIYAALEAWMKTRGARWLRLGVVEGNQRGARFWHRVGYQEMRKRVDYEVGPLKHVLHVMAKPLVAKPDWDRYRRLVPRDDPANP